MAVVTRARIAGVFMLIAGLAAGTALDRATLPAPLVRDGFHVLAADLHVHAFPGDGALPPWELTREAARRGLHVIVVSNHNQTLAARWPKGGADLPLVIPAQEVTTPAFHLIAAGIETTVDWRRGENVVDDVHAQGGVAIAAHPVVKSWRGRDDVLTGLDGAEVAHPMARQGSRERDELDGFFARALAVNPDLAAIGSSDFHMVAPLGAARTYVFAETVTTAGVLEAIRAGRAVAEAPDGRRFGPAHLVAMLPPPVGHAPSPWSRVAAAFALGGALFLMLSWNEKRPGA